MKKFIALSLAVLMMLGMFAGCNASDDDADTNELGLVTEGKLTVATSPDFSPMEFVDLEGNYVGFDIMLAEYIAEELGLELEIVPMSFDACQTAVSMGTVDMSLSGFSWKEDRAANYNLSDYYHAGDNEDKQTIIVLAENAGKFTTAESLAGQKVGAQGASLQETLAAEQLTESEIVTVADLNTALMQLRNGDFVALVVAEGNGEAIIANNPDIALGGFYFDVDEKYTGNVIMMTKGDDALTEKVNEILAASEQYWGEWYEAAQNIAGVDVSYDDEGNVITDTDGATDDDTEPSETDGEGDADTEPSGTDGE